MSASVQSLGLAMISVASAATEAGEGAQHALEGYRHAVSALALGAQIDLALLRSGRAIIPQGLPYCAKQGTAKSEKLYLFMLAGDAGKAQGTDAEVQRHLLQHEERAAHAHMRLSASRRLQEAARNSSSQIGQMAASLQVSIFHTYRGMYAVHLCRTLHDTF